ncbi:MAG: alkaline phosphatase family protein, partial [Pyrinomonadaceae bacterium]
MSHDNHPRVLVVTLDAAEPTLIRRLIDQGRMPTLRSLLAQGRWSRVDSPASIGSGAVWPTFMTGQPPSSHGVYGEWAWQPATMSLQRFSGEGLTPFWKEMTAAGVKVGVLDVPFAPMLNLAEGFELMEWGPHDTIRGHVQAGPGAIADLVSKKVPAHPFSSDRHDLTEPHDHEALGKLTAAGVAGIRLRGELAQRLIKETRPDLAIINFTELHHCGHFVWHTIASGHESYQGEFEHSAPVEPSLEEIYTEVDNQIGRLLEVAGNEATVMVFSLHGMGPARGLPAILGPLLSELGFARLAGWKAKSW